MHHPRSKASRARFALSPVALVVATLLSPAHAQDAEPGPQLKPSPMLREDIPVDPGQLPTFVEGDRISGQTDLQTTIEGDAVLRRGDTVIRADKLEYTTPDDLAKATGNVRINKAGNSYEGSQLELKVDAFEGFFSDINYRFLRNDAYGEASRVDFLDDKRSVIHNATYTTCQREGGPGWMPAWMLRATSLRLDQEEETGQASGAILDFMGVPVLPVPSLSFPLSDKRKSGLLPPTFGLDNVSGFEYTQPYYWNIAPNRDATLYPTLMSKRGVDLGGEFRYLEPGYDGTLRGNYLPGDRLRDRDRWGYSVQHYQPVVPVPLPGTTTLNLNLNRVSDDDYWRDFSRNSSSLTQRLLTNDGFLSWGYGDLYAFGRALKYQVLQDPTAPIIPPYDRYQFQGRWTKPQLWGGMESLVEADYSQFQSEPFFTGEPNGHRGYSLARISRPWQAPGWFIVPKAQVHATRYEFDTPLVSADPAFNGRMNWDRVVPTASLDSGLVFERNTSYFGRDFLQTLEPRAFYVYTPFREQNGLPLYDTAQNDFNFATIYTENAFSGNDRIADNNLLTVGVTTRLLDPATGAEAAKFGMAQRFRFSDQRVGLDETTPVVSERLSDLLFGASLSLVPQWSFDTTLQYNPKTQRSIRSTIGGRYMPKNYHVISAAYRLQRGLSESVELGWQWPLNDLWGDFGKDLGPGLGEGAGRWYSVGRLNYSMTDGRLVDAVAGLEYDGGCWLGRVVLERLQAGTTSANKRILFQLEFVGFTRLGTNALQSLKENIPRYQYLRENVSTPSRFGNYD